MVVQFWRLSDTILGIENFFQFDPIKKKFWVMGEIFVILRFSKASLVSHREKIL